MLASTARKVACSQRMFASCKFYNESFVDTISKRFVNGASMSLWVGATKGLQIAADLAKDKPVAAEVLVHLQIQMLELVDACLGSCGCSYRIWWMWMYGEVQNAKGYLAQEVVE
jgi:hypothetical protein